MEKCFMTSDKSTTSFCEGLHLSALPMEGIEAHYQKLIFGWLELDMIKQNSILNQLKTIQHIYLIHHSVIGERGTGFGTGYYLLGYLTSCSIYLLAKKYKSF